VPGGKFACKKISTEMTVGEGKMTSTVWSCEKVPGGMVKLTSTMSQPKSQTDSQLVEYKAAD